MFSIFKHKQVFGTGAIRDPHDIRDYGYEKIAAAGESIDWNKGTFFKKYLTIAPFFFCIRFKMPNSLLLNCSSHEINVLSEIFPPSS